MLGKEAVTVRAETMGFLETFQDIASQCTGVNGAANSDATVDTPEGSSTNLNRHVALSRVRKVTGPRRGITCPVLSCLLGTLCRA